MKINLLQPILDFEGVQYVEPVYDMVDDKPIKVREVRLDLKTIIMRGLNHLPKDKEISPETIYDRGKLISKVRSNDEVDLSAKQIEEIKKCVAKITSPFVTFQVWEMLDKEPND
jgi:epoxyqueuosine reductase QueG